MNIISCVVSFAPPLDLKNGTFHSCPGRCYHVTLATSFPVEAFEKNGEISDERS